MNKGSEKHRSFFNIISRNTFLAALIICALFSFVYIAANGFKILSGNDDYCVFNAVLGGNTAVPCLGFFFTSFCALIQPLFGVINVYMVLQELICFFSLAAINYFFLAKLGSKRGLFYTAVFDAVFLSFIIVEIMYTYTAVLASTAGLLCILYGSIYEKRRRFKIIQLICGFLLLLNGSQLRFAPFGVCCGIGVIFVAGELVSVIARKRKRGGIKKALASTLKKYAITGVLLAAAFISAFGLNVVSDAIKDSSEDYRELSEYYESLSAVNDAGYYPYNKSAGEFEEIGLKSAEDYYTLRAWFVDDSFFTVDRLNDMAGIIRNDGDVNSGVLNKSIPEQTLYPFKYAFSQLIKSKFILLYLLILIIAVFGTVILSILFPKIKWMLIKLILLVFIWSFYFLISDVFDLISILLLPLMVVSLLITFRYDRFQAVVTLFLVAGLLIPYAYLVAVRLNFYTALCPIFPAFVLMIFGLNEENLVKINNRPKLRKISLSCLAVFVAALSVFTGVYVYIHYVRVYDTECNPIMEEYIENHPDTTFLVNQTMLMKSYYDPFILSEDKPNVVDYGLWLTKAKCYKDAQKANGIDNIFKDAINSNMRIIVCEPDEPDGDDDPTEVQVYTVSPLHHLAVYYNNHYAEKGEVIEINKTDQAGAYSIYEVVSMPADAE